MGTKRGRLDFSSLSCNYFETSVEVSLYVRRDLSPLDGFWAIQGRNLIAGLQLFPTLWSVPCTSETFCSFSALCTTWETQAHKLIASQKAPYAGKVKDGAVGKVA